jgi:hypothetical protein
VLTIIGTVSLSPAYAPPICTFSTNGAVFTIMQGTTLTVTGTDTCNPAGTVTVVAPIYTSCVGTFTGLQGQATPVAGSFSVNVPTSTLNPGTYCITFASQCTGTCPDSPPNVNDTLIVSATPIPEYPLGLPILAIFMIIGYGVIRRKTITKQK